jgi:hypothetical protein
MAAPPPELPPTFVGWLLPPADRSELLELFPPAYDLVVADHVTSSAPEGTAMPDIRSARIVGIADDGKGVQALVVEINGTTDRPDGSTYHLTWSLDSATGRDAHESNDVIRKHGWRPVDVLPVRLDPTGSA